MMESLKGKESRRKQGIRTYYLATLCFRGECSIAALQPRPMFTSLNSSPLYHSASAPPLCRVSFITRNCSGRSWWEWGRLFWRKLRTRGAVCGRRWSARSWQTSFSRSRSRPCGPGSGWPRWRPGKRSAVVTTLAFHNQDLTEMGGNVQGSALSYKSVTNLATVVCVMVNGVFNIIKRDWITGITAVFVDEEWLSSVSVVSLLSSLGSLMNAFY